MSAEAEISTRRTEAVSEGKHAVRRRALSKIIMPLPFLGWATFALTLLLLRVDDTSGMEGKREALRAQAEAIAAAIGGASADQAEGRPGAGASTLQDGTAVESLRPERLTPILRRSIQARETRARVYDVDGVVRVDTETARTGGQLRVGPQDVAVLRNLDLRSALSGRTSETLVLNSWEEPLASVVVPIELSGSVIGAVLLSTRPEERGRLGASARGAMLGLAASLVTCALIGWVALRTGKRVLLSEH